MQAAGNCFFQASKCHLRLLLASELFTPGSTAPLHESGVSRGVDGPIRRPSAEHFCVLLLTRSAGARSPFGSASLPTRSC